MANNEESSQIPPFVVTVSGRALFDLEESHAIFEKQGMVAYSKFQRERENDPLCPGPAMSLVRKLLALNDMIPDGQPGIDVMLLSRNSADSAHRLLNSLNHHGLGMVRAVLTSGTPTSTYIEALKTQLFLSANPIQVGRAIEAGVAAATVATKAGYTAAATCDDKIRIAFDGDAVLFGDASERAYQSGGLDGFNRFESEHAKEPMEAGPFRGVLEMLHRIQTLFDDRPGECPVRTALVTARSIPASERALATLRHWGVRVDEAMFLGGNAKGPILRAFGADLFFDDSSNNIKNALEYDVASAHVPYGARNAAGAQEQQFSGGDVAKAGTDKARVAGVRRSFRP